MSARAALTVASRIGPRPMSPRRSSWCRVGAPRRASARCTRPTGLVGAAAAGAGDARHGDGEVGVGVGERALGHGAGNRLADGAVRGDEVGRHAELLGLGGVGVGDEAALDDVGGAGDLGEQGGDQPAGATLGGGELQRARAAGVEQAGRFVGSGRRRTCGASLTHATKENGASGQLAPLQDREQRGECKSSGSSEFFSLRQKIVQRAAALGPHHTDRTVLRVLPDRISRAG